MGLVPAATAPWILWALAALGLLIAIGTAAVLVQWIRKTRQRSQSLEAGLSQHAELLAEAHEHSAAQDRRFDHLEARLQQVAVVHRVEQMADLVRLAARKGELSADRATDLLTHLRVMATDEPAAADNALGED